MRRDGYNYYPAATPTPICRRIYNSNTVSQYRTLTNAGIRATVSYVKGKNNIKAGINFGTGAFRKRQFADVNPTVNAVCLNADGSFDTNPLFNNPQRAVGQCRGHGES